MKIIIVGAGASGISAAIRIKEENPNYSVTILERKNKIGSKILASGNGKCNIGNKFIKEDFFNNTDFYLKYLHNFYEKYDNFLKRQNILIKEMSEGRLYPFSFSSKSVVDAFSNSLKKHNIEIVYNCKFVDFSIDKNLAITTFTTKGNYYSDKLILSCGGKSYKELGTDGYVFEVLNKKGLNISKLNPSITGFILKENVKDLFGLKLNCKVCILNQKNEELYGEIGEVVFKKDGISGIAIMNLSFFINKIKIDFLKEVLRVKLDLFYEYDSAKSVLSEITSNNGNDTLLGIVDEKIIQYFNVKKDFKSLEKLKNLIFTIKDFYGFDYAQVTNGGLGLDEINEYFELKKFKNIYVIGETLDIDGKCGGYNLYNAISNGVIIGENINEYNNK